MKKHYFLFLFLLSTFAISQVKIDSVFINKDSLKQLLGERERLYTTQDIALIDSLVLENQVQSVFMDEIKEYYISNTDTTDVSKTPLDVTLLKERLVLINETTPSKGVFETSVVSVLEI